MSDAKRAIAICDAMVDIASKTLAESDGYPGAIPVQAALIQAQASYQIATALNRIAIALEAKPIQTRGLNDAP